MEIDEFGWSLMSLLASMIPPDMIMGQQKVLFFTTLWGKHAEDHPFILQNI